MRTGVARRRIRGGGIDLVAPVGRRNGWRWRSRVRRISAVPVRGRNVVVPVSRKRNERFIKILAQILAEDLVSDLPTSLGADLVFAASLCFVHSLPLLIQGPYRAQTSRPRGWLSDSSRGGFAAWRRLRPARRTAAATNKPARVTSASVCLGRRFREQATRPLCMIR